MSPSQLVATVASTALIGCGGGPPSVGSADASPDATVGELFCGQLYCLELAPPSAFVGLSSIGALEVSGGRIEVASERGDGIVREYAIGEAVLEPTGLMFELADASGPRVPNPRAFSSRRGTSIVANRDQAGATIVFFDADVARAGGSLDGAIAALVADDVVADPSGPEFVILDGTLLVASGDRAATDNRVRLYDPITLQGAASTSDEQALAASFASGPFIDGLFFWPPLLVLVENAAAGSSRLLIVDLKMSVASGVAVEIDAISVNATQPIVGIGELADGRLILVGADASARIGLLRSARPSGEARSL